MTDQLATSEKATAQEAPAANRPLSEAEQAERGRIAEAFQRWGRMIGDATSVAEIKTAFQVMDKELPEALGACPELSKIN